MPEIGELLLKFLVSFVDLIELTLDYFVGLSVFKFLKEKLRKMRVCLSLLVEFFSKLLASIDESCVFFLEFIDVDFKLLGLIDMIIPFDFFHFNAFFFIS
jgi:hypothetical protein